MPKDEFLYKKVYSDLKVKIESGQLQPGSKLPGEEELRETYQVSVITIKRALQILANEKLIRRIPGKGSFVMSEKGKPE